MRIVYTMFLSILLLISCLHRCAASVAPASANDLFTVAVISNNRLESLKRLCNSLLRTHNPSGRKINLLLNLEASSSEELQDYAYSLQWPFGQKIINVRIIQGGLIRAVLESWYPSHDSDYGVLLEDDIEVSPLWLLWVDGMLSGLRNGSFGQHTSDRVVGISLYSPKVTETVFPKRAFDSKSITLAISGDSNYPYFMQTPCSWGAVYFPKPWRSFLAYAKHRLSSFSTDRPVLIPNSRTNGWKQSWKKFMFELLWMRGEFLLYPNFPEEQSFSTNHMESGEHVSTRDSKELFTVGLLKSNVILQLLVLSPAKNPTFIDSFGKPFLQPGSLLQQLQTFGIPRKQNLGKGQFLAPAYNLDIMASGHVICSQREDIIRSESTADGYFYQAVLQDDGNFVVYKQQSGDDSVLSAAWASQSSSKSPICLYLSAEGEMYLVNSNGVAIWGTSGSTSSRDKMAEVNAEILRGRSRRPDVVTGTILSYPVLRLESNGNLVVYRNKVSDSSCTRRGILWSALPFSSNRPARCSPKAMTSSNSKGSMSETQAHRIGISFCRSYPLMANNFVSNLGKSLTIILSYYDRPNLLFKQIMYYAQSPYVSTIIVIWRNMQAPPLQTSMVYNKVVHFIQYTVDSLNNIFNPSLLVATDAVLVIDPETKVSLEDISLLYAVWLEFPRNIVGLYDQSPLQKMHSTVVESILTKNSPRAHSSYGFISRKVMLFHRDLLWQYTCNNMSSIFLDIVDDSVNCEDIIMNGVASLQSHPGMLSNSAPLLVKPLHRVGDFSLIGNGSSSKRGSSISSCVEAVKETYGKLKLKEYPLQSKVVIPKFSVDGSTVSLRLEPFFAGQFNFHTTCTSIDGSSLDECNFELKSPRAKDIIFVWNN